MTFFPDRINLLLKTKTSAVVAIEGNSTAGKSTLAAFFKEKYSCNVVSTDHFFLRPEQRTLQRLAEPGGNIDYERFFDSVILPLKSGNDFDYIPYNCQTGSFDDPVTICSNKLTVIEGVYCMHPVFSGMSNKRRDYNVYDITVFLEIDEDEQKRRLKSRNPKLYERFINEWIPMENKYFGFFDIAGRCDYVMGSEEIPGKKE